MPALRSATALSVSHHTTPLGEFPAWMADGVCAQVDPELFFPEKGGSSKSAKAVCMSCDVRAECAAYAVESTDLLHGIWGGLSERDRRPLRREFHGWGDLEAGGDIDELDVDEVA
jgi:WhiB family redox-sensing transcriptional regulator